jgi:hypothetical protein
MILLCGFALADGVLMCTNSFGFFCELFSDLSVLCFVCHTRFLQFINEQILTLLHCTHYPRILPKSKAPLQLCIPLPAWLAFYELFSILLFVYFFRWL